MNRSRKRYLNWAANLTAVRGRFEGEDCAEGANVVEISTHLLLPLLSFLSSRFPRFRVFKSVLNQTGNPLVRIFFFEPCGDRFLIRIRGDDKLAGLIFFAL